MRNTLNIGIILLVITAGSALTFLLLVLLSLSPNLFLEYFVVTVTVVLTLQGVLTMVWMLYAWEDPEFIQSHSSPNNYLPPVASFTALLPAKNEDKVIADTIRAINDIEYPKHLKELIVLCRYDDHSTIKAAQKQIEKIGDPNIRVVVFDSLPVNKPHALNIGLRLAKNEVISVFDAEDEPHREIYKIINTVMINKRNDVVQSGVQLMNFNSSWFSTLNVIEYFLWFKSGLNFFTRVAGITPLGGNTVFFKKSWLNHIGGWDEKCLTEDADVGFRLASAGAKIGIVYDERHVTREETPTDSASFVKQRTRWNQGFLQVLLKGDWLKFASVRQKIMALYILLSPFLQAALIFYTPFGLWYGFTQKMPVYLSMMTYLPFYVYLLQIIILICSIYLFTKTYKIKFPLLTPFRLLLTLMPYQVLLTWSAIRAVVRMALGKGGWEKTAHTNAHRQLLNMDIQKQYAG